MSDETAQTGFIIKAVSTTGLAMWVSPPRFGEHRTFGPRESAEAFRTKGEALATIGKLPGAFETRRIHILGRSGTVTEFLCSRPSFCHPPPLPVQSRHEQRAAMTDKPDGKMSATHEPQQSQRSPDFVEGGFVKRGCVGAVVGGVCGAVSSLVTFAIIIVVAAQFDPKAWWGLVVIGLIPILGAGVGTIFGAAALVSKPSFKWAGIAGCIGGVLSPAVLPLLDKLPGF